MMDPRRWILFISACCVAGLIALGCGSEELPPPTITSVSAQELKQLMEADADILVLDVRTPEEHAAGHIVGAVNIPHSEIGSRMNEINAYRDKHIIVCCWAGGRADAAKEVLRNAGFTSLLDLRGHMAEWERLGYPVERQANQ